jgi:hypothetical protein
VPIGRDGLASLFCELGFKEGAEIGVETGGYSEVLLRANPGLKLYCVDPWKAYRGYRDHVDQKKLDHFYGVASARLEPLGGVIVRKFSMDAVKDFKGGSLDFVYIDGNHNFSHVAQDIHEWGRKVKSGGIVSGHDYQKFKRPTEVHVMCVVNGYTYSYGISPWFLTTSKETVDGVEQHTPKSYFWVKA